MKNRLTYVNLFFLLFFTALAVHIKRKKEKGKRKKKKEKKEKKRLDNIKKIDYNLIRKNN